MPSCELRFQRQPIRDHGRPNRKRWIGVEAKRRDGALRTVFRMRKRTNELFRPVSYRGLLENCSGQTLLTDRPSLFGLLAAASECRPSGPSYATQHHWE